MIHAALSMLVPERRIDLSTLFAALAAFLIVAWEDYMVLSFECQANPVILAQNNFSRAYIKPDSVTSAVQHATCHSKRSE